MRAAVAAVAAAALLVACGEDGPPTYDSVEDLHGALERGGAGCTKDRVHHDAIPRVDTMTCNSAGPGSDGSRYLLVVWQGDERPADLDAVLGPGERVEGTNWAVTSFGTDRRGQAERVRAAVGGTYVG